MTNLRNLEAAVAKLQKGGVAGFVKKPYVIDLAAGAVFKVNVTYDKFPTITKSHANSLWLLDKGRFATLEEILKAQGISPGEVTCPRDVSRVKLKEMAGNSFTLPVFQRLFSVLLPALGVPLGI